VPVIATSNNATNATSNNSSSSNSSVKKQRVMTISTSPALSTNVNVNVNVVASSSSAASSSSGTAAPPSVQSQPQQSLYNSGHNTVETHLRRLTSRPAPPPLPVPPPPPPPSSSSSSSSSSATPSNTSASAVTLAVTTTPNSATTPASQQQQQQQQRERTGRWLPEEHRLFLEGLERFGKKWTKISAYIGTRTAMQVRTHAQKYFQKLDKVSKDDGLQDAVSALANAKGKLQHHDVAAVHDLPGPGAGAPVHVTSHLSGRPHAAHAHAHAHHLHPHAAAHHGSPNIGAAVRVVEAPLPSAAAGGGEQHTSPAVAPIMTYTTAAPPPGTVRVHHSHAAAAAAHHGHPAPAGYSIHQPASAHPQHSVVYEYLPVEARAATHVLQHAPQHQHQHAVATAPAAEYQDIRHGHTTAALSETEQVATLLAGMGNNAALFAPRRRDIHPSQVRYSTWK